MPGFIEDEGSALQDSQMRGRRGRFVEGDLLERKGRKGEGRSERPLEVCGFEHVVECWTYTSLRVDFWLEV